LKKPPVKWPAGSALTDYKKRQFLGYIAGDARLPDSEQRIAHGHRMRTCLLSWTQDSDFYASASRCHAFIRRGVNLTDAKNVGAVEAAKQALTGSFLYTTWPESRAQALEELFEHYLAAGYVQLDGPLRAEVGLVDVRAGSPLELAVRSGSARKFGQLIAHGANPDVTVELFVDGHPETMTMLEYIEHAGGAEAGEMSATAHAAFMRTTLQSSLPAACTAPAPHRRAPL